MIVIIIVVALGFLFLLYRKKKSKMIPIGPAPEKWKKILTTHVNFYKNLNPEQRLQFESDVQHFLNEIRITGVQTDVTIEDRLLVASSAVIPLFGFPAWNYKNLDEVLLYPTSFDRDYTMGSKEEIITGMVGSGVMEGKMILSKPALHAGFDISNDKKNVGIHEFVHLFDKEDGVIDGIPPGFQDKAFSLPWLSLVKKQSDKIVANHSDIDGYGATNQQEFFAVASEYFFERPDLLKTKHPELYQTLSKVFNQDMATVIDSSSYTKKSPGRNDPCPCGSGEKFKNCCLD
jgi:Mlc titration factor MtfA (ptsG expression regulator)